MIHDDLPTNPEYLDEYFGSAAGLREFSDDELEDLEDDPCGDPDAKNIEFVEIKPGSTFSHNGETIKVYSEGINVLEEYYENLPAAQPGSPVAYVSKSTSFPQSSLRKQWD